MSRKAYSYVRFSTPEQKWGDSKRRQLAEAKEWADKKGIELDTSLEDLGKSGYKGLHRKKGALGRFLEQVTKKVVPRGSYLVIEDIDRLSREHPLDATTVLTNLLHAGITIVNLRSGAEISSDSVRADAPGSQFAELIADITRAHRESQRKARLSSANWQEKLEQARKAKKVLTSQVPGWIRVEKIGDEWDRKNIQRNMSLIEDRANLVKDIFDWCIRRGMGTRRIADRLNAEKIPCWGKGLREGELWHSSYIQKILHSRTVLGELELHRYEFVEDKDRPSEQVQVRVPTGEVLKGYYPRLVSDKDFKRAEKVLKGRAKYHGGKHSGRISNLVSGLTFAKLYDHFDKESINPSEPSVTPSVKVPVVFVTKNAKKFEQYLVTQVDSTNRKRVEGTELEKARWNYHAFEYALLTTLQEVDWREIADWVDGTSARTAEEHELSALEASVKKFETEVEKAYELLEAGESPFIRRKFDSAEHRLEEAKEALEKKRAEMDKKVLEKKVLAEPLEIEQKAFDPFEEETRLQLRAELAEKIKEIVLIPKVKDYRIDHRERKLEFYYFHFYIIFNNGCSRYIKVTMRRNRRFEVAKVTFNGKTRVEIPIKPLVIPDDEVVDDHLIDQDLSAD